MDDYERAVIGCGLPGSTVQFTVMKPQVRRVGCVKTCKSPYVFVLPCVVLRTTSTYPFMDTVKLFEIFVSLRGRCGEILSFSQIPTK